MKLRYLGLIAAGLGIALFITLFSPFASSDPDGLEKVAEDKGFLDVANSPPYELISDYVFPWVDNEDLATILSGIVGVFIVAAVVFVVAFLLTRVGGAQRPTPPAGGPG
jgi:cobalt/nickel transport protein